MEIALVLYPSLAILVCYYLLRTAWKDSVGHGEQMYQMGKRHGREEAALKVWELSHDLDDNLANELDSMKSEEDAEGSEEFLRMMDDAVRKK